ncbi:MAG: hypothetical protein AVDCRST_MAG64-3019 [uncultured Phycisphaerae bacterium]|uniref:Uncharacterized protein n=1 Tax=uncultured Phycisphaerae bacterium TaxID=904963 RepID=A0A6J4PVI1_9BACT|nr:MAG: hypothetical protein AVDCRST_MAG64-3019 [uncultured Phycisphaerae bacterium]
MTAVLQASKVHNSVIDLADVCATLKMSSEECKEFVRWAGKSGLLTDLTNDQAILTAAGRAFAQGLTRS